MYDVTMKRFRVTSDVDEDHKNYCIFYVFVSLGTHPETRMRHNVICGRTCYKNVFLDFS